ncbi:MAG: DUF4127 family protein [Succiniclasticum sp.]|uniref:DUF4127 family protein n=1 Tax=Succiniclasticum sp. TaxID=2775030 RepID=UPI002A91B877|nr:DUF4127 family protein [Succiniclasticum sp.]MDY6291303.1 DUF4127 family protein [Succiniclasticum sp.]
MNRFRFAFKWISIFNFILFTALGFVLSEAAALAKEKSAFIFIPMDNRPVCFSYPVKVMEAAGYKIYTPPEKLLATRTTPADTEKLWKWLESRAEKVDAAVISTDALIYGGLVASRTHSLPVAELERRVNRLKDLHMDKNIRFYGFSTLMRTPRESYGNVEPAYYSHVGPAIYRYSQLSDKSDLHAETLLEDFEVGAFERNLAKAHLKDWLDRRNKNMDVNRELAMLARMGRFDYFAIGKDDNAPLSHTHMEARKISFSNADVSDETFQILPGVDQLGLLLLTRAANELSHQAPKVYQMYVEGVGPKTIPQYSDLPLGTSIPEQIIAAGGKIVYSPDAADVVLAINTPANGTMYDSTSLSNQYFASPANKRYIANLGKMLDRGVNVSLADVAFSNGGDNGFMNEMSLRGYTDKLSAYNGWNTADNTIGFAISQGMLAPKIAKDKQLMLMRERIIDDWYYQSNARRLITDELEKEKKAAYKYTLNEMAPRVKKEALAVINRLAVNYDITAGTQYKLDFPWNRLFEVDITNVKQSRDKLRNKSRSAKGLLPDVPVYSK